MLEGVLWIVVGCVILILSWTFDLGSLREPGQGFVGFLAGIFLCGVGTVMILSVTLSQGKTAKRPDAIQTFRGIPWPRLTWMIGLILGYILFLDILGFMMGTFLLMYGMFFDRERKSWVSSFMFSIATAVSSYLIFEVGLHCQLPRGVFP